MYKQSSECPFQIRLYTPKKLLEIILREFIDARRESLEKITLLNLQDSLFNLKRDELHNSVILLKRVYHPTQLVYSSAIAHKLAAQCQISATDLAAEIVKMVSAFTLRQMDEYVYSRLSKDVSQGWKVQVALSGLIQFELRDSAIADWLDSLIRLPFPNLAPLASCHSPLAPTREFHKKIFAIQHAHARCCSLLSLAHRAQLITLDQPNANPKDWQFVVPASVPWLTPNLRLYTNHPIERQLVNQLLVTLDELGEQFTSQEVVLTSNDDPSGNHKRVLDLATNVSQAFQAVHCEIQILGSNFRIEPSDRRHAHLGLLLATQQLLHLLLKSWLEIEAPSEL